MAFVPGYNSRVLLGPLHLSCYVRSTSFNWSVDMHDISVLCTDPPAKTFMIGRESATYSADGPLDVSGTAGDQFDVLATDFKSTQMPVTYAPSGVTALDEAWLLDAMETNFTSTNGQDDAVAYTLSAQSNGWIDPGVVLEGEDAVTATGDGDARDLTAQTTNGGVAHLHATAWTSLTSNDIIIEHSADGSTGWSTLVTFTQLTDVGYQRVEVAAGTTVERYLRVADTVVGSGSMTRTVAFARR